MASQGQSYYEVTEQSARDAEGDDRTQLSGRNPHRPLEDAEEETAAMPLLHVIGTFFKATLYKASYFNNVWPFRICRAKATWQG